MQICKETYFISFPGIIISKLNKLFYKTIFIFIYLYYLVTRIYCLGNGSFI